MGPRVFLHKFPGQVLGLGIGMLPLVAHAYPEFQRHIQQQSGRFVSCGMCHSHPDGPDGSKHGQIQSLVPSELEALARSRGMVEPRPSVDSPILNDFGDYLVSSLGGRKLTAWRETPATLVSAVDPQHDLDRDGIADVRELRDGTDPTDNRHGAPWRLFVANAERHRRELGALFLATGLGLFGLRRLFGWCRYRSRRSDEVD